MNTFPAPLSTTSEQLSTSPTSMPPELLTRLVRRTETLRPGLVPIAGSPLARHAASTILFTPENRKRCRGDDEETAQSHKRLRPSTSSGLCVHCRCTPIDNKEHKEEESEKDKENCDPSAPGSSGASTPQPELFPASNTGSTAAKPPTDLYPMCKSARAKPVLSKESSKGVFRPQPFRRFPTTKNVERVTMRNNLRDIFVGRKVRPTNVRYARDAPPRPRPRGTYASNAAHRGLLSQPVTKRKYHYRLGSFIAEMVGLPEPLDPSVFLGSGENKEWRQPDASPWPGKDGHLDYEQPDSLRPWGIGSSIYIPPLLIRSKQVKPSLFVYTSPWARAEWGKKEAALRELLRKRAEEAKKAGGPKPESRRRGPDGTPISIPPFPLVRSRLGVELGRGSVEGGDEEGTIAVGAPTMD